MAVCIPKCCALCVSAVIPTIIVSSVSLQYFLCVRCPTLATTALCSRVQCWPLQGFCFGFGQLFLDQRHLRKSPPKKKGVCPHSVSEGRRQRTRWTQSQATNPLTKHQLKAGRKIASSAVVARKMKLVPAQRSPFGNEKEGAEKNNECLNVLQAFFLQLMACKTGENDEAQQMGPTIPQAPRSKLPNVSRVDSGEDVRWPIKSSSVINDHQRII